MNKDVFTIGIKYLLYLEKILCSLIIIFLSYEIILPIIIIIIIRFRFTPGFL